MRRNLGALLDGRTAKFFEEKFVSLEVSLGEYFFHSKLKK